MIAPSIFASSDRRCGVNSASSRNPPEQMFSTAGPSPTTISAPILACRMRSIPSRSGVPGRDQPQRGVEGFRSGLAPTVLSGSDNPRRVAKTSPVSRRAQSRPRVALASRSATRTQLHAGDVGGRRRDDRSSEAEPQRLGEPARRLRDLADLAAETELADDDGVGVRPACRRAAPAIASATARSAPGSATRDAAGDARVHVVAREPDAGALLHDRDEHRRAGPPSNACATRRGDRRAASARPAPAPRRTAAGVPSSTGGDDRARRADPTVGEEQRARIGDRHQPVAGHLHQAELVGGRRSGASSARNMRSA